MGKEENAERPTLNIERRRKQADNVRGSTPNVQRKPEANIERRTPNAERRIVICVKSLGVFFCGADACHKNPDELLHFAEACYKLSRRTKFLEACHKAKPALRLAQLF
jgi:hypothetical protein